MGMPSRRPFLYHSLLSDILNRRSRKIIFTAVRRGRSTLLFYILLCYKSTLIFLLTKRHRTNYNNSIRIQFLDCTGDDPVLRLFMRRKNTAQGFFPHVFSKDKHRNDNGLSFHHRPGTSSLVYLYWLVFFFRMQANVAINPAKAKQHRGRFSVFLLSWHFYYQ